LSAIICASCAATLGNWFAVLKPDLASSRKWIIPPTTSILLPRESGRVHAFSYILGYSRRQYVHFVERQDFTTTVRQHISAFTHLKGLAADCLYDNMKVVVTGYDGEQPIYNTRFLAFATTMASGPSPAGPEGRRRRVK